MPGVAVPGRCAFVLFARLKDVRLSQSAGRASLCRRAYAVEAVGSAGLDFLYQTQDSLHAESVTAERESEAPAFFPGCFTLLVLGEQVADDDPRYDWLVLTVVNFRRKVVRPADASKIFGAD